MEGSIFRLENGTIILNKDAALLCPTLRGLTPKQIEYLILVYDPFDSPIWKKPLPDRQRLAKRRLWGNITSDPEVKIPKLAIEEIKAITYNSLAMTIDVYRNKIKHLNDLLFNEVDVTRIGKITETLQRLLIILDDFEKQFNKSKEILLLKGGKSLSFLEMKQRQARDYAKNKNHTNDSVRTEVQ
jgi:hypothetical protein